jgi:hypothetical protein
MSAWDDATDRAEHGPSMPPRPNRQQRRAYVRQAKTYKLSFEDDDMDGLEVRAKSLPLGTFMDLIDLAAVFDGREAETTFSAEDAKAVRQLFEGFSEALVSWNLEAPPPGDPEGPTVPVPATLAGLYSQDFPFVLQVINSWMSAVASVPGPLGRPSPAGSPSLEASMPMDVPSPSQAS